MLTYCEHWKKSNSKLLATLQYVEHMNSWWTSFKDHCFLYSKPALYTLSRDVAQYRIDSFRSLLTIIPKRPT